MAEAVIGGALVAVLQDLIGLVDFLELDFAGGIARILVRMPFHRELAEGRLQLGIVGGPFDFQGFVIAALGGHPSVPNSRFVSMPQERVVEDAAFGLTKNDPHSIETRCALFGVGVMIANPLVKRTSCCSCRRRPR